MVRSFILRMFVVAAAIAMSAASEAALVSRYNPYRSFNAAGVNYGAHQWQRTHGYSSSPHHTYYGHAHRGC